MTRQPSTESLKIRKFTKDLLYSDVYREFTFIEIRESITNKIGYGIKDADINNNLSSLEREGCIIKISKGKSRKYKASVHVTSSSPTTDKLINDLYKELQSIKTDKEKLEKREKQLKGFNLKTIC